MKRIAAILRPVQNLGLLDRAIRTVVGVGIMAWPAIHLASGNMVGWHAYAMLAAVYPLLTAMLGWDPFYATVGTRTCSDSGRGQCGTFPYEVDAALGHDPFTEEGQEYDHSMSSAHHTTERERRKAA